MSNKKQLNYFTHAVDGRTYGGWYRVLSARDIEVLSIGLMETAIFTGPNPETTARLVLEEFVRRCILRGREIPSVIVQPQQGSGMPLSNSQASSRTPPH